MSTDNSLSSYLWPCPISFNLWNSSLLSDPFVSFFTAILDEVRHLKHLFDLTSPPCLTSVFPSVMIKDLTFFCLNQTICSDHWLLHLQYVKIPSLTFIPSFSTSISIYAIKPTDTQTSFSIRYILGSFPSALDLSPCWLCISTLSILQILIGFT